MVVGNKIKKKKKRDRDRERERNEECNITTGKQRCFPLSLFLIKIKNNLKKMKLRRISLVLISVDCSRTGKQQRFGDMFPPQPN